MLLLSVLIQGRVSEVDQNVSRVVMYSHGETSFQFFLFSYNVDVVATVQVTFRRITYTLK